MRIRLSRRGENLSDRVPEVVDGAGRLSAKEYNPGVVVRQTIDGEIVETPIIIDPDLGNGGMGGGGNG
ncbi:MAG: hypothetical protein ACOZAA_04240 [Pseudomonadota bacterium]